MNKIASLYGIIMVFFLVYGAPCIAQPSGSTVHTLRRSTVKVESGNKVGTGFLWNKAHWVVTTLHSIENKDNITITLVDQVKSARVLKVLKRFDLALLELESEVDLPVLRTADAIPGVNSNLYVLGYNGKGNLSNIIDRSLRLGYNSNGKLKGLLSTSLRTELNTCKSPDPEIDILYFDGSLLPGFSGAPIVDSSGALVGIADGGLENGAQSISWGIAALNLSNLSTSDDVFTTGLCSVQAEKVKFSSENLQDSDVDYIPFESFKFIKIKTRTIEEMQATVDDPLGLQQLINSFSMTNNVDYLSFTYDIYMDVATGATICLPEGMELQIQNGLLVGRSPNSDLAYIAWPSKVSGSTADWTRFQNPSVQFENSIISYSNMNLQYQQDYNYSYRTPISQPNGIMVNRKAFYGYGQDNFGNYGPRTYLFETHIGVQNTYLGMAVVNLNNTQAMINLLNTCVYSGQCIDPSGFEECSSICENYKQFSQLVLGVHMGGFSNIAY